MKLSLDTESSRPPTWQDTVKWWVIGFVCCVALALFTLGPGKLQMDAHHAQSGIHVFVEGQPRSPDDLPPDD